jgi:hypothetical protein
LAAAPFEPPQAFLQKYCLDCHTGPDAENSFDIDGLGRDLDRADVLAKWVHIHDRIERGEMPPADATQPTKDVRAAFLASLAEPLTTAAADRASTVLRRLNRGEYEHTLNDMLGGNEALAELLPEDSRADGFDNVGEALDLSAVQLEAWMTAARQAIDGALRKGPKPESKQASYSLADGEGAKNIGKFWRRNDDGAVVAFGNGRNPLTQLPMPRVNAEGPYRFAVKAYPFQTDRAVTATVWQGGLNGSGKSVKAATLVFPPSGDKATTQTFTTWLEPTDRIFFYFDLPLDFAKRQREGADSYDGPGLAIAAMEVEGPLFDEWPGRGHALLFGDLPSRPAAGGGRAPPGPKGGKGARGPRGPQFEIVSEAPEADAERLLRGFLPIAFRRPITNADLEPFLALFKAELKRGSSFEESLRTAYVAVLCAPDFLYLAERPGKLGDFPLACRLSYAFWNTLPDEELTRLAAQGALSKPDVLRAQVERLANDPRAARFVTTFTGQWLKLREIDFTTPDKQLYPEYDDALRDAMLAETERFFAEVLATNSSVLDFIDSDWTMLNERLAAHYRIPGVEGPEIRRVSLEPEHHRGGVLTHASVLKVSANGTTTSPVIRGVFVLERILGVGPPPPPPGVPGVEPDIRGAATLREQLAKHRDMDSCNACHRMIDPPGFALENYDVMGGWRENYRSLNTSLPPPPPELRQGKKNVPWRVGPKVDASGETAEGRRFTDLADYKRILLAKPEVFTRALVEKVATYLTGRSMGFSDRPELERITAAVAKRGYGFRDLIHEVVQSEIFRNK